MMNSNSDRPLCSTADEREVANCLLEMSRKGQECVELLVEPVVHPRVPKKRGRKPKKKKATPLLMKQSKKALTSYARRLEKKPKECTSALTTSETSPILIVCDMATSSMTKDTPIRVRLVDSKPAEKKINKIKLVKVQDGARWLSQVVQNVEVSPPQSTVKTTKSASPVTPPRPCIPTLPSHSLPFKKRKLASAFPEPMPNSNCLAALEKTPEKGMPKASLQSPGGKIMQQMSHYSSPSTSKVPEDDIQVLYESPPQASDLPEAHPVVTRVAFPAVKNMLRSKSADIANAKLQEILDPLKMPELFPVSRRKHPMAMVVRPMMSTSPYPPSILPDFFKHYNQPHEQPKDIYAVVGANLQETQVMGKANEVPMPVRVDYRILSDSWPLQPKLSVYEIQPVQIYGSNPLSLVSTFVLLHRQRSETKSLHYLSRFPSLCQVRFEYQPKMPRHHQPGVYIPFSREQVPLPVHVLFQQITDEHLLNKADLAGLRVQYPNSTFCTVVEDHRKVVNKIAVIYVDEDTGCAHVKTFAFVAAVAAATQTACPTSDTVLDSWFNKVADTMEVFRLTIPAWMFFSREVIRLHRLK